MSQEDEDRIVGQLFRESEEARRKMALVDMELKNVRDAFKDLSSELPDLTSITLEKSRHASFGKYVNLEVIRSLLEEREEAARKVEEFGRRLRGLKS